VALDSTTGSLLTPDSSGSRVLGLDRDGTVVSTINPGSSLALLAVTGTGVVLAINRGDPTRLLRFSSTNGQREVIAGTGVGDGGTASTALFSAVLGMETAATDNLYLADGSASRIRRMDFTGAVTTIAGTEETGFNGRGGAATAAKLS
jgi:hypothetical protein